MADMSTDFALERVRFGPIRTLNLRAGLPTGPEAASRVESWLRTKQVELSGDVLIITGRGKNSLGGIPVVREATRRVLTRMRRAGVVASHGEDTPGSFVVTLAPLRALLEAPNRRARKGAPPPATGTVTIAGLRPELNSSLQEFAIRSLEALGVREATHEMVSLEMQRHFSLFARALPAGADPNSWLSSAIARATREHEDSTS